MIRKWAMHALVMVLPLLITDGRSVRGEIKYRGYFPSFPTPAPAQGIGPGGGPGVWMGADASFMCPLDQTRSFWSFADAGIGPPGTRSRLDPARKIIGIGHTIAIATCKDGRFSVQHYYRGTADRPLPIFADPNNPTNDPKGSRLWLRKSLTHQGKLYIFAHQIIDPGQVFNTFVIRVANPLDSPLAWSYDYLSLGILPPPKIGQEPPARPAPFTFGNEAFLDVPNNYLYTYGSIVNHDSAFDYFSKFQVSALRIPLDKLETAPPWADLSRNAEFMTSKFGEWKLGLFEPDNYHRVGIPAILGFSTRYNATLKAWQAVFCHDRAIAEFHGRVRKAEDPLVNSVFLMTGPTAYGPWTRPIPVVRIPEMDPTLEKIPDRAHGPDSYYYCLTEQPAFETWDGDLVFCYTIGSVVDIRDHNPMPKLNNLKIYNVYAWPAAHPLFGPREIKDRDR